MAELAPQTSVGDASGGDDALSKLHKMSRTAGLGSTEYVAINVWAVVCVLLGLASALALLSNVLLIIPITGTIFAIIALVQINSSNGTQGGKGLAWTGLVLSFAFTGLLITITVANYFARQADYAQIGQLVGQFSDYVKANDMASAYEMGSPLFKRNISRDRFDQLMSPLHDHPVLGALVGVKWTELLQFPTNTESTEELAQGRIIFEFEKGAPVQFDVYFRQTEDGKWMIDGVPDLFDPKVQ
jgi:hypothetical protein